MAATGRRGSSQSGSANTWWLALGVSGAALVALPLAIAEPPVGLPPMFHEGTRGYEGLMSTATAVDRAFALGNLQLLRAAVTAEYMERLEDVFQRTAHRQLDRTALREQGVHIGNLRELRFLLGRSSGNRACLAYDMARRKRDGGYPVTRAVFALRFVWDESVFRLDARSVRKLQPGQTAEHLARRMVRDMLRG